MDTPRRAAVDEAPPASPPPSPPPAPAAAAPASVPSAEPGPGPSPGPAAGPDAASARLRLRAKTAGFLMLLMGALFATVVGISAYSLPRLPETQAAMAGGNLTVSFPGGAGAEVVLDYAAGAPDTVATLGPDGNATLQAANATFDLRVSHGGRTWVRQAFLPQGFQATVVLGSDAPNEQDGLAGVPVDRAGALWLVALVPAAVAACGWFAFRLRAPRVALAGAALLALGGAFMVAMFGFDLLTLGVLGTGIVAFLFIHRARFEFRPMRSPARPAP